MSILCLLLLYFDYDVIGRRDIFFRARFAFLHTHASLTSFVCFCILFHFCCSHARVFGKILVHEFPYFL